MLWWDLPPLDFIIQTRRRPKEENRDQEKVAASAAALKGIYPKSASWGSKKNQLIYCCRKPGHLRRDGGKNPNDKRPPEPCPGKNDYWTSDGPLR